MKAKSYKEVVEARRLANRLKNEKQLQTLVGKAGLLSVEPGVSFNKKGAEAGVCGSTISKIVKGKTRNPSCKTMIGIARAAGKKFGVHE